MCSVSWLIDESGYQVFFNRDEQKSRAQALTPKPFLQDGVRVIMPIDPVGQGSWISLNKYGVSLCLLNNYQGTVPTGRLISRGQLLKTVSSELSVMSLYRHFETLELNQFAPFTLLAFELGADKVRSFEWNGEESKIGTVVSPHFSSGVELAKVSEYRLATYKERNPQTTEELLAFHSQHHPTLPHMSVCMHRVDAETVSFTRIKVTKDALEMAYVAGCPCCHLTPESLAANTYPLLKRAS